MNKNFKFNNEHHPMKEVDGTYYWSYRLKLLSDFTFFSIVLKVLMVSIIPLFLLLMIIAMIDGDFIEGGLFAIKISGLTVAIILGLALLGWVIYIVIHQNRYDILYEMDDEGILLLEGRTTREKNNVISRIGMVMGGFKGNTTLVGSSTLALTKHHYHTSFKNTNKVTIKNNRLIIKASGFRTNVVYFHKQDRQKLLEYIGKHLRKDAIIVN